MANETPGSDISSEIDQLLTDITAEGADAVPDAESVHPSSDEAVSAKSTAAQILDVLQTDARASKTDIAERVGVSTPTVTKYIDQLEAKGIIVGYSVDVDPTNLKQTTIALVEVDIEESSFDKTVEAIQDISAVHSLYTLTDSSSVLAEFRTAGFSDLSRILSDKVLSADGVTATRTTVLEERHT